MKMFLPALLLLITTLTGLPAAEAQWVKFTVENTAGIPALSVRDIVKGSSSEIWFASENGVFRRIISSDTWIALNTSNSNLPSNSVNDIHSTGATLLFATDNGIAIRQSNSITTIGVADGLPSPFVQGISGTSAVSFWAATYGGGLVRQVNGIRSYYSTDTGLPTDYYRCVFRSSDGAYWFGSANHGAVRFHSEQWAEFTVDDGLAGNTILDIAQDAQSTLWMAGTGGLSRLVNGQWEAVQVSQGANSNIYYCLTKMHNGQLWAGGDNGIDVFENGEHVQHITTAAGLNANSVSALYSDNQGELWVGYAESGTSFRKNGIWYDRSWGTGLSSEWVNAMATDEDGRLHFGTDKMTTYDGHNWRNYGITNGYSIGGIATQMWKTNDGRLWAANSTRYAVKDGDQWQSYAKPILGNGTRMVTQSDGTQWYCHSSGVYSRSANGEQTLFEKNIHLDGNSPENILTDSEGRIWVISTKGLCCYQDQQWNCFQAPSPPMATYVLQPQSMTISPDGNPIFIAQKKKVGQLLPGHFVVELVPMGNKRLFVDRFWVNEWASHWNKQFRLASDTYGGIWMACPEIYSTTVPACIQFTASGVVQRHFVANGIPSRRITAMMDDGQGYMWLSTRDGYCRAPLLALAAEDNLLAEPRARTLHVYPNPTSGRLTLEYTPSIAQDEMTVHDLMGRELLRYPLTLTPQRVNEVQIDLGRLPGGAYLLRTSGQEHQPARIIITENQ